MEIKTRLGIKIVLFFFVIRCFCFALRTAIIEVFETQLRNCIRPNFCQSYFQIKKNQFFVVIDLELVNTQTKILY